ncbi:hypothetical protein J6590_089660 [Homalodisca vitripennis]|nr:hypothetical protein J6590_089660 [Homalodisca vitripennis]
MLDLMIPDFITFKCDSRTSQDREGENMSSCAKPKMVSCRDMRQLVTSAELEQYCNGRCESTQRL